MSTEEDLMADAWAAALEEQAKTGKHSLLS